MKGKMILRLVLILGVFMQLGLLKAQTSVVSNEKYYASSLYNFTRFVKWPASQSNQNFKIAVVGSEAVYEELKKLTTNRKYGQHSFQISYFRKHSDIKGFYHMVYLSTMNSGKISSIKSQNKSNNTMFITERQGMGAFGSAVSFYVEQSGRITFELSNSNFRDQGLVVSSALLSLAGKVSD